MEHVRSKAKMTAKRIVNAPQKLGHSILTAPDKIFNKQRECQQEMKEERDEATAEFHGKICSNIIDDQSGRIAVRESQEECMREITEHLNLYIFEITSSNSHSVRYDYKNWIEALHPDNVNYVGSGRPLIDHRFYMKDSHHRILWNEYMIKLDCRDAMVREESRDPTKYTNDNVTFVDTLAKWPNEICGTIDDPCGLFP